NKLRNLICTFNIQEVGHYEIKETKYGKIKFDKRKSYLNKEQDLTRVIKNSDYKVLKKLNCNENDEMFSTYVFLDDRIKVNIESYFIMKQMENSDRSIEWKLTKSDLLDQINNNISSLKTLDIPIASKQNGISFFKIDDLEEIEMDDAVNALKHKVVKNQEMIDVLKGDIPQNFGIIKRDGKSKPSRELAKPKLIHYSFWKLPDEENYTLFDLMKHFTWYFREIEVAREE
ncbi:TPA: hypothetical protein ACGORL_002018, partial [Streptococcus suis]